MRFIIFLILTSLFLGGCGAKGPLYLPESRYPQPVAAPTTEESGGEVTAPVETVPAETAPIEKSQESK